MKKEQAIYKMAQAIADFTVSEKSISSRKLATNLYESGYRLIKDKSSDPLDRTLRKGGYYDCV